MPGMRTIFRDSRLAIDDVHVRMVRPDMAVVDVHWTMSGAVRLR